MNKWIYIFIMFAVTYLIRVLPLTLIRKKLKNTFIRSFLYYVPYVTRSVMTFPAILHATMSKTSGLISFIVGIIAAWFGANLFKVALICCTLVFIIEYFIV